jgi:hypothetical protein
VNQKEEILYFNEDKMLEFALDGTDGSAKTPICEGVLSELTRKGIKSTSFDPFQEVRKLIPESDIYPYWKDGRAETALHLIQQVVEQCREDSLRKGIDVLLYDRLWLTLFTEIDDTPLASQWNHFVPTFILTAPREIIVKRPGFSYGLPFSSSDQMLDDYHSKYLTLSKKYSSPIFGSYEINALRVDLRPIIKDITTKIVSRIGTKR